MATVRQYKFEEAAAVNAVGARVDIPAGVHSVERHALLYRVRLRGREVDLTLAEFDRLARDGKVVDVADPLQDGP